MQEKYLCEADTLDSFSTPAEVSECLRLWQGWTPEVRKVVEQPYSPSKILRYYQLNAIDRTVKAIARVEELRRLSAQLRERLTEARRTQGRLAQALVAEAG